MSGSSPGAAPQARGASPAHAGRQAAARANATAELWFTWQELWEGEWKCWVRMLVSTGADTSVELLPRPTTIATRRRVPRIGGLPLVLSASRGIEDPESPLAIENGQLGDDL